MKSHIAALPKLGYLLLACFLVAMAYRSHSDTTLMLVVSSVLMFFFCWVNATHLLGAKPAFTFVVIAVVFGWFAEQMGSSRGWFFGVYTYTNVLGWRLGEVPMIIPLMWFALCYTAYIIANFAIWQYPVDGSPGTGRMVFMSFLAAMIVTAYDLGADPYMVFVLKAWIMGKTDGWWFGETLQGFVGWVFVAGAIVFVFRLVTRKQGLHAAAGFNKTHALLPFGIYGLSMVFTMLKGFPVETRTVAVFAMGIPLLCALAGWWRWKPVTAGIAVPSPVTDGRLAQMQFIGDPPADNTIASVLGPWKVPAEPVDYAAHLLRIAAINRQFDQWTTNQSLVNWQSTDAALPADINLQLQNYLKAGQVLPNWMDRKKIEHAEKLFTDYGPLSCTMLFCASLPECYVIPDLSAVLHMAGQLEKHTEYRIRATAAMIFPVMMRGGLLEPTGGGVAQILKVRLIHATIRNLILRGAPHEAIAKLGDQRYEKGANVVPKIDPLPSDDMYQTMFSYGWRVSEDGLPCSQDELAYTLLTFGYVFLRSMRVLEQALTQEDEEAYLHTWNVVGHVLGIRRELMPDSMDEAEAMFNQIQANDPTGPVVPDPRPALANALMQTMELAMPWRLVKPFPVLLTRYLCGSQNAETLGIHNRVSWVSRALFGLLMLAIKAIDCTVRLLVPKFSVFRLITRVLGYHLIKQILLDQTRPLKLPAHLINGINNMMGAWGNDALAPQWMNKLEDRATKPGKWNEQGNG
jgi:uncharacterized membrane protein